MLAGLSASDQKLQIVVANYQIAASLMGPIPGGNDEEIDAPGLGHLASMTYLDRRTFTYPDKDGYALTITSIPDAWGDVTVEQYRIDASNDLTLVNTQVSKAADRTQGADRVGRLGPRATEPSGRPERRRTRARPHRCDRISSWRSEPMSARMTDSIGLGPGSHFSVGTRLR